MRRIVLAVIFFCAWMPGRLWADNYTTLWKQWEVAANKDLPQSQLALLDQIIAKSSAERAYGHLVKARLCRVSVVAALSTDSLQAETDRMETLVNATRDQVLQAVYYAALGRSYGQMEYADTAYCSKSKTCMERAMAHPDVLAKQTAKGMVPFVINGVDSRAFRDDLLHVIGIECRAYKQLYDYYRTHDNRRAACLSVALDLNEELNRTEVLRSRKSELLQRIDALINEYQDLQEAGELAILHALCLERATDVGEADLYNYINYALSRWGTWPRMNLLRNMQSDITNPTFNISLGSSVLYPGEQRTVRLNSIRNINEITVNVYRLTQPCRKQFYEIKGGIATLRRIMERTPVQSQTLKFYGQPTYKISSDTMVVGNLPIGTYVVEAVTDNRQVQPQYELLHVTGLTTIRQPLPDNQNRIVVVDAVSGEPVKGAKVEWLDYNKKVVSTLTTDAKGEAFCKTTQRNGFLYAYTAGDNHAPYQNGYGRYAHYEHSGAVEENVSLFTDRSLYRPGQTVHVSLLAYKRADKVNTRAMEGKSFTVQLRDANHKVVAEQQVTTDVYGTAATDFVLPATGLTGNFTVRVANSAVRSIRVEAYKRPTFRIEFDEMKEAYENGDTITLVGHAKTFAGVALQGAKVAYTVTRDVARWWWYRSFDDRAETMAKGEVKTEADGSFRIKMPMVLPDNIRDSQRRFYQFTTAVTVTDLGGESHSGSCVLPMGTHATALSCDLPEKILVDSLQSMRFTYTNSAGKEIAGEVRYTIDGTAHIAQANQQVDLRPLATSLGSGEHRLQAVCGTDTLTHRFVVFSFSDERCVTRTHDWFYLSDTQFPSGGKPIRLQLGSSDEQLHVVYTIVSGSRVVEQGVLDLDGRLHNRQLTYQPEWGDGLCLSYAWVKEGKLYEHNVAVSRPLPDKRLTTSWVTFRDRLIPGQKEEWTLRVSRPDGTPAAAQLMATLYDKSLDMLYPNAWTFSSVYYPHVTMAGWYGGNHSVLGLYGYMPIARLADNALDFSHFDEKCFFGHARLSDNEIRSNMVMASVPELAGAKQKAMGGRIAQMKAEAVVADMADAGATDDVANDQIRENLSETAFFYPMLETDDKGEAQIRFTLPESLTTWRFMGLAHDTDMNFGFAYGEAVAQKKVMVQPNVPRFLRQDDKTVIFSRISNTSDKTMSGTATLELTDAETQKRVYIQSKEFTVEANATIAVSFEYTPAAADLLLICKVIAKGRDFSDGEQHYLPILPDKEQVTNTIPFTRHGAGTYTVDLGKLFPVKGTQKKLTVEYTDNPSWLMIQALPAMGTTNRDNAVDLVSAYYANSVAASLLSQSPVIRQTLQRWQQEQTKESALAGSLEKNQELKTLVLEETPWVMNAQNEGDRKRQLINYFNENQLQVTQQQLLDKLGKLQRADGAFGWCPGMEGSEYMTVTVAETLVRLNRLVGRQTATDRMLDGAMGYLDKWLAKYVAELKKEERKGNKQLTPGETACHYLYTRALAGKKATADVTYLLSLLEKQPRKLSIYGKVRAAVVLALNGRATVAGEYLRSLKEYTVCTEEMGRYFDTPKAVYSWMDYRIPTQTAAIEAIQLMTPADRQTIEEMQRWLLQEKRTQSWDTPISSVNAVYAFLHENTDRLTSVAAEPVQLKVDGKRIDTSRPTASLGYVKGQMDGDKLHTLTIGKTSGGTSWGAVYAQSIVPVTEVGHAASGLSVKREVIANGKTLKVGDRVKVRVTLHADRDFDFVQLVDKRAACLEPVVQLSGYRQGYYTTPRDHATHYYFNKLAKGKHVIETEYYVDRAGEYQSGTCTVQCAYSPEYMGREAGMKLTSENE